MRDSPANVEFAGVACRVLLTAAVRKQRRVNRAKHALFILCIYQRCVSKKPLS